MRKKLYRWHANALQKNVIELGKPLYHSIKGNWHRLYFKNDHKITVELGCGYGDYTVGLSQQFSNQNFIGVDIKGARLWKGSQSAITYQLQNTAFLRTRIEQLDQFFAPGEITRLYLPFPDPRSKARDAKRRLISPRFLELYRSAMSKGGSVHIKTDCNSFYEYALNVLATQNIGNLIHTEDLYQSELLNKYNNIINNIKTAYEKIFLEHNKKIKYVYFEFL